MREDGVMMEQFRLFVAGHSDLPVIADKFVGIRFDTTGLWGLAAVSNVFARRELVFPRCMDNQEHCTMDVSTSETPLRVAYRAWRAEQMAAIEDKPSSEQWSYGRADDEAAVHPWRRARARITAFRERVAGTLRWQPDLEQMPLIRRALGIPAYVPMTRRWWMIVLWLLVTPFTPLRWRMQAGLRLLRRIRTYDGRQYVFERLIAPVWGSQSSYSDGMDHALRQLPLARRVKPYEDLLGVDRGYVEASIRLGLSRVEDIPEAWREIRRSYEPDVVLALIDEGILRRVDELGWIPTRASHYMWSRQNIDALELRAMARELLSAGMPRDKVPLLLDYPYGYDPVRLSATLALLRVRNIVDVAGVFEAVGDRLWRCDDASWCFVIDTVGAHAPEDIRRFRSLLDLSRPAPVAVVEWMREHGASLDELADARGFLTQVSRMDTAPVDRLDCLAQWAIPVSDIVHCADYVLFGQPEQLLSFFNVLARHGYGDRASILAFYRCYTNVRPEMLDRWLSLAGPLNDRAGASTVAKWVARAQARRHIASLEYVISKMPPANLNALSQRLFVMDMCPALVRHVVEEQGLNDPKELNSWYYAEAWGVKDYAGGDDFDAVERILMEDAFRRKNFAVLEGNRSCLDEVVSARVRATVPVPTDRSEAGWKAYHDARHRAEEIEREALRPMLPAILAETRGILLRSLLETAWRPEGSISSLLAVLRPLMADLAYGRGPVNASLTDLEVEAVALVYGVAASLIREYWHQVIGQQTTWAATSPDAPYVMHWQRSTNRINRQLDHDGLRCLAVAVQFARRFDERDGDVFHACKHLRAGVLAKPLVDHYALQRHLGVLLAAAGDDEMVKDWMSQRFEALSQIDDESAAAHREIGELNDFFLVTLPDALLAGLERFVARFNDSDARHLALRLDAGTSEGVDGHSMLRAVLQRTRDKVLKVYQRWSAREKGKFKTRRDEAHQSTLHAFISKYPAAFFAKQATGLCSWDRVTMWKEARHAHLVVFDPLTGKLAGLALLYTEVISALDASRPALIIRGINPTVAMIANHEPHSVVDAFFSVAIEIARTRGLAGVAFPSDGGQDFMSNRTDVGKVIRKRYEKRSVAFYRAQERSEQEADWRDQPRSIVRTFDAYEQGSGRVETLYAIWRAPKSVNVERENQFSEMMVA